MMRSQTGVVASVRAAIPGGLAVLGVLAAPGCGVAAPNREPQSVLRPMLVEVNGLLGQVGGEGRIADGPTRVHCNPYHDTDPTVRWQVFARAPVNASTPVSVAKAVAVRRAAGWTVDDKGSSAEPAYRLRKDGMVLAVTYLRDGRGDVVLSGQSECFVPTGAAAPR